MEFGVFVIWWQKDFLSSQIWNVEMLHFTVFITWFSTREEQFYPLLQQLKEQRARFGYWVPDKNEAPGFPTRGFCVDLILLNS